MYGLGGPFCSNKNILCVLEKNKGGDHANLLWVGHWQLARPETNLEPSTMLITVQGQGCAKGRSLGSWILSEETKSKTKPIMSRPGGNRQTAKASLSYEFREASRRNSEMWWEGRTRKGAAIKPGAKKLCCHQRLRHRTFWPQTESSCQAVLCASTWQRRPVGL